MTAAMRLGPTAPAPPVTACSLSTRSPNAVEAEDGNLRENREYWLYNTWEEAPRRLEALDGAQVWAVNPQETRAIEGAGPPWRVVPLE